MKHNKALLLDTIHEAAHEPLQRAGFAIETFPVSIKTDDLIDRLQGASVVGVRSAPGLPVDVFERALDVEAVGVFGVGTDHVALDAASDRGVIVFNAPSENGRSVAEWTMGSIYSLLRRIHEHSSVMHNGIWAKSAGRSYEVRGKTLGVIGFGNIGRQVVDLAEKNDMEVCYYDKYVRKMQDQGHMEPDARSLPLSQLLARADIVTLHTPGLNRPILGRRELASMKEGAYVINGARASVLDYDALIDSVEGGHIAGAALDVYPGGDAAKGQPFVNDVEGNHRFLLTPHIGGSTKEAQTSAARNVAQRIANFILRGAVEGAVNMGAFDPGPMGDEPRLVYAHRNAPSAEAELTKALADHGLNIERGDLRTHGSLGMVVKDIDGVQDTEQVLEAVKLLSQCRSARIISAR